MCKRQAKGTIGEDNYIYLSSTPATPPQDTPSWIDSEGYEYITMVQLCNIAEKKGLTRTEACNSFGGDRGKIIVEPARMAREAFDGDKKRKFVLVDSATEYFKEKDINW